MDSKFVVRFFLICFFGASIVTTDCFVRVDWDSPNPKKGKNAPSQDAFPTAEEANLTQVERAKLIQEKNESDFLRKVLHWLVKNLNSHTKTLALSFSLNVKQTAWKNGILLLLFFYQL